MNFPELASPKIKLSKICLNNKTLDEMTEYSILPEFYEHMEFYPFKNKKETELYLNKLINRSSADNCHYWFILDNTDKVIGTFGVFDIDTRKGSAEIGYGLSPKYWGQGLFKESLSLVLDYLFYEKKFSRICAKTQTSNQASIHGLLKLGFKEEGVLRNFYLSEKTSEYYDATILSILKNEYIKE
jgi:ribosomal-protein-alanine N-acetyltransferase